MSKSHKITAIIFILLAFSLSACDNDEKLPSLPVPGDERVLREVFGVTFLFSETGTLKAKVETGLLREENEGTKDNPKIFHNLSQGVTMHFYGSTGKPETRLTCKEGKIDKDNHTAIFKGNVIVVRLSDNAFLQTEELHWDEKKEKIFSTVHTKVQEPDRTMEGEYFESNTLFTRFQLSQAKGEMKVNEM